MCTHQREVSTRAREFYLRRNCSASRNAPRLAPPTAIRQAKPRDLYYVFMGFCPNADLSNRVDGKWREQGICSINLWESAGSERQAAEFMSIKVGDLVILKKNQKIGETMRLSGFGRVTGIRASTDPTAVDNVLIMDWSPQTAEIDVPFMGCTATVNLRDVEKVDKIMPQEFQDWLGEQGTA